MSSSSALRSEPSRFRLVPLLVWLSSVLLVPAASAQTGRERVIDEAARERIDSTLSRFVEAGMVAGVSALVYEKGEEAYFGAFGMADQAAGVPMDRNTIVQIFSMTKPITGVALMQLQESGLFELDDPLSRYAPEFGNLRVYVGRDSAGQPVLEMPRREITIRDLTRHTAGFVGGEDTSYVGRLYAQADPFDRNNSLADLARDLASVPLVFHPGEQWAYGPSVDVQAYLVEKMAGIPFAEYLRERIFLPLGMHETRYLVPATDSARFSAMYRREQDGDLIQVPREQSHAMNTRQWPLTPGGWGLTSTIDDYMRFALMLQNEGELDGARILRPETVRLMATNQLSDSVTERHFLPSKGQVGFGIDFAVRIRPPASADENPGEVGEFFWDGAASTLFWVDPRNDLTAVLFVQLMPFDPIGLQRSFRGAVYGTEM